MRFSQTFISRPIFATVLALLIVILGGIGFLGLPVAHYPEIAPPAVVVNARYPGANAETVAKTVAAVIEQEVNGVEDMLYMTSQSTADGSMSLVVTFAIGTDLDRAQVQVQNRVAIAEPRLPEEVRRSGITVRKNLSDLLMVIHMISKSDRYDQLYLSNYALLQIQDELARIKGVGGIRIFGGRDYSMRVWLDPGRLASLGLTAQDVVAAISRENVQVAGGALAEPPVAGDQAFQIKLQLLGRLSDPAQFENIVVKSGEDGRLTHLKDVARIELGALSYTTNGYLDGERAVVVAVTQLPGANALATANGVKAAMDRLAKDFPQGIEHRVVYNPTDFIARSIEELVKTILEAVVLVVLVVLLFLQTWRATVIPLVAIPVSLIGTFAAMAAFGYSINNLTLFGLVLATGIVVDDAIVVVENVERRLRSGLSAEAAARATMNEVGTALVSIALVLCAVFVPAAFLGGIAGQFYRQFALTIAVATVISAFISLTLSPALCAILLHRHDGDGRSRFNPVRLARGLFRAFNHAFDATASAYSRLVRTLTKQTMALLLIYAGLIALTASLFLSVPKGFIPSQDKGYLIVAFQLPSGASLARTDEAMARFGKAVRETPGVAHTASFAGFSGATFTSASNAGAMFVVLEDYRERARKGLTFGQIYGMLAGKAAQVQEGLVFVIPPPPVHGVGTGGGFQMYVQDRGGIGLPALAQATYALMGAANQTPGLRQVFTSFFISTPQLYVDVDRARAKILNVPLENIFETLRINLGSTYVNDFNLFGRTYRATVQADARFRLTEADVARLKVRSADGAMVPLGSLVTFRSTAGPDRVPRYNLFPAVELNGNTAGISSGEAIAKMEDLAGRILPEGVSFAWTGLSFQEKTGGGTAVFVFGLSVLFAFLALAAQYESWTLPLAIILIVPMCLLAALGGVTTHALDVNILTEVGFIVLVGLAAKNAILVVEFARQLEDQGRSTVDAAIEACRLRLRPIIMTSLAFTLGVLPLYVAGGAGAEMRQALGTAVFFGMLGVTAFGLIFTPVFYVSVRKLFPGTKAVEVEASAPAE